MIQPEILIVRMVKLMGPCTVRFSIVRTMLAPDVTRKDDEIKWLVVETRLIPRQTNVFIPSFKWEVECN